MNFPEDTRKVPQICKGFLRQLTSAEEMAQSVKSSSSKHEGLGVVSFHHVDPEKQTQIVRFRGGTITTVHQARAMLFKTKPGVHGEM